MTHPVETTLERKIRERKEKLAAEAAAVAAAKAAEEADLAKYADLVPEDPYQKTDAEKEIDSIVGRIGIIEAYNRWNTKNDKARPRSGQTESIKVRCPNPNHPDKVESYWMNTDKDTGNCGVCGGYDQYDIAAFYFGFDVPGYKEGKNFPDLKKAMAISLGYTVTTHEGKSFIDGRPEDNSDIAPDSDAPDNSDNSDAPDNSDTAPEKTASSDNSDISPDSSGDADAVNKVVTSLYGDPDRALPLPELDWRPIVPKDTFLDEYMKATIVNESPEPYHFFSGLMAIGFALGRSVSLGQVGEPVYGNLFVCLLGNTGVGKSISQRPFKTLLTKTLPYSSDPGSKGCKILNTPGSAEQMIRDFEKPIVDPLTFKPVPGHYESIHGLVEFNEIAALVGRADRKGAAFKSTLMQFFDMDARVTSSSLSTGAKIAVEPFCSLVTTTQPKSIRENLTRADDSSGFLNRFTFVCGSPKKRDYMNVPTVDITPAVAPLQLIAGWAGGFISGEQMGWTREALSRWDEHFQTHIYKYKTAEETAIFQRLELHLMKIMMLLSANKMQKNIEVETVEQTLMMYDYLVACYTLVSGELTNTAEEQIVQAVMGQLQRFKDTGINIGALYTAIKHKKFPRDRVLKVVDMLVALGQVEKIESSGGRGRPTIKYRLTA